MIVYGDPSYQESLETLVGRLRARLPAASLDDRRSLLVQAGQLEQAVHDGLPAILPADESGRVIHLCESATDVAARAFVGPSHEALRDLPPILHAIPQIDVRLRVKVPEGFAFYALYPEAYRDSARRWAAENPGAAAAVVGVRTIGTALSAVVAETLRACGLQVRRATVRPSGHPFHRECELDPALLHGADWVLVVDEGPGLSGSSMAAVAEAATAAGFPRGRVAFFPGHGGEPGAEASPSTRRWWAEAPRYVSSLCELRWEGRALEETLAELTGRAVEVQDLSAAQWRRYAYADPADWPAATAAFERTKYRVVRDDGSAVLWRFSGLLDSRERETLCHRAELGLTVPPVGETLGFVGVPWVEGARLRSSDRTPEIEDHLTRYISAVAGPPLTRDDGEAAQARLIEMLVANAREAFGDDAAERAAALATDVQASAELPTYGDGRLAPHEWVRARDGRLVKTDGVGHDRDHTTIGRQPIAWDVAGAIVEWDLGPSFASRCGMAADAARFYCAAYAAFRLGLCAMSAGMTADESERARLKSAEGRYRDALTRALGY